MVYRVHLSCVPTLETDRLRLVPLGLQHFEDAWSSLNDQEALRLTGTQTTFEPDQVRDHLDFLARCNDRADWAVIRKEDDGYIGEVVLNDLDAENRSMNFRILLTNRGQGYGTEATRAVVACGFDVIGLHRIHLGVYAFNPRAQRTYEKCGFVHEGVQRSALNWKGEWVDLIQMAILATDPR